LITNGGDATNGVAKFSQVVEDVNFLSGETVTLSIWLKADSAKNTSLEIQQYFGTGGSPSSTVSTPVAKFAITSSWAQYVFTFTIPSITGKTIGTTPGTSGTYISLWQSAGTAFNTNTGTLGIQTGTFDFAMAQLELGPAVTTFEQRDLATEITLAQRYYEKTYNIDTAVGSTGPAPGGYGVVGCNANAEFQGPTYKVRKRIGVAPIIYSVTTGTANTAYRASDAAAITVTSYVYLGEASCMQLNCSSLSTTSVMYYHYVNDADF
jgi:hypothetical protein